jgi:hypothetical protein
MAREAGTGVTASGAKDRGAGVLASFALATFVETLAAVGAGAATGAMDLSARALLPSMVEFAGALFGGGVDVEESSMARFAPVDLLVLLMVSFAEFIFKFT